MPKVDRSYGTVAFRFIDGQLKFLLVWETWGRGHWSFPRGRAKKNEQPVETARRELWEETGLVLPDLFDPIPIKQSYTFSHKGVLIQREITYFLAHIPEGNVLLKDPNVIRSAWMTLEEILQNTQFIELHQTAREAFGRVKG